LQDHAHAAGHEGLFPAQKVCRHAAGHLTQQADNMEHALGQTNLPQGEAPGRQQRYPYRIRDAQAGEEIGSVNAGKLLFQIEFTFMVHGEHPFYLSL